jgi:hypothetical protein
LSFFYLLLLANIGPRSGPGGKQKSFGSGRQTLRFKANGSAKVEEVDDARYKICQHLCRNLLEVRMSFFQKNLFTLEAA